jgi:hypothetical protein
VCKIKAGFLLIHFYLGQDEEKKLTAYIITAIKSIKNSNGKFANINYRYMACILI